jgi:hypothetical protein
MPRVFVVKRGGKTVFRTRKEYLARAFVRESNRLGVGPCLVLVLWPDLVYPKVYPVAASAR